MQLNMTTMVEKIKGTPVRAGRDSARPTTSSRRIMGPYGKGTSRLEVPIMPPSWGFR